MIASSITLQAKLCINPSRMEVEVVRKVLCRLVRVARISVRHVIHLASESSKIPTVWNPITNTAYYNSHQDRNDSSTFAAPFHSRFDGIFSVQLLLPLKQRPNTMETNNYREERHDMSDVQPTIRCCPDLRVTCVFQFANYLSKK
jgi:hypothetical protein